jgi:carboxyl-terminal processing protease
MLPACNKGVGMNMGFPDVCLTPAPPGPPVPIPYPNMAMHAMAAPFSPSVMIQMLPALNMGSMIPVTMGMEPGVMHPFYKQMGMFTTGSPVVFINGLPGITLTCPTTGNMMNNAVGIVQVAGATTVLFSLARTSENLLDPPALSALARAVDSSDGPALVGVRLVAGRVGYAAIRRFTSALPSAAHHAIAQLAAKGMESLVLDLRGNPGGDAAAAIALAGDFLAAGSVVAVLTDGDGDETVYRATGARPHLFPLTLLVDRWTASAAELFAGSLQAYGRAVLVGETTYGKGVVRAVVPSFDGPRYEAVAVFRLPDGRAPERGGLSPDLTWEELGDQRSAAREGIVLPDVCIAAVPVRAAADVVPRFGDLRHPLSAVSSRRDA